MALKSGNPQLFAALADIMIALFEDPLESGVSLLDTRG